MTEFNGSNLSRLLITTSLAFATSLASFAAFTQDQSSPDTSNTEAVVNPPVLNLFEAVEVNDQRTSSPASRPTRESRATSSEPLFTLIGTSRIGSKTSALLRHQNGENIRLTVNARNATPITGYEEYSVFDVGSGSLSVRYPSNVPCVGHKEKGVSCAATGNTAQLQLVNAEAIAIVEPSVPAQAPGIVEPDQPGTQPNPATNPNPFEALRQARAEGRAGSGQAQSAESRRFTPRRIAPEDVPPGMRVVSTPFGDRLVEE